MGKQLLFYMTAEDEADFALFAHSSGDVVIFAQTSKSPEGTATDAFAKLSPQPANASCHLWNREISPTPEFRCIPEQECYWLDFVHSEVVNIMRSTRRHHTITMGRLHIVDTLQQPDGTIAKKSEQFVGWFKTLCNWIRREYDHTFDGAHVSSRVHSLTKQGLTLTGHLL